MADDAKALAQRFYDEVMGKGSLEAVDEIIADDFVEHEAMPGLTPGKDGLKQWVTMMRGAFPDLQVEVVSMAADGDEVWAQVIARGTHKGPFMDIPATGNSIEMAMFDRIRLRDGQAVEHWGVAQDLAMMQQLGVIPEMG